MIHDKQNNVIKEGDIIFFTDVWPPMIPAEFFYTKATVLKVDARGITYQSESEIDNPRRCLRKIASLCISIINK